jgi:hypothetical protein
MTQPEALRLAASICDYNRYGNESEQVAKLRRMKADTEAAAELRRLHESNKDLLEALKDMGARYGLTDVAREAIANAEGENT